ncbi:MAG: foldase protein PrsA [Longimicrobiales bacterium]
MTKRFSFTAGILALALTAAAPLSGQAPAETPPPEGELDRVLAIVGDSVVLLSQVLQREAELKASGAPVPTLAAERDRFLNEVLDDLVSSQILLQAAARDTLLSVDDDRVADLLQQQISQTESSFGGRAEMERALQLEGLSMQSYREMLREQLRQQQLVGQYVARQTDGSAVEVTDLEMRTFFEEQRGTLAPRPATISFRQVVLTVEPSDSAKAVARTKIDSLLVRVREGEEFGDLAREYSQDPGSATAGGDLGWSRRGSFVDEFEDVTFNLLEGEVSDVIETPFGFHIIQVDQIRFSERRARHILIQAPVGQGDLERTETLANELAERAKEEGLESLTSEYHDPLMPDSATVPLAQIGQMLSPAYETALSGRQDGDLVGPLSFDFRGEQRFAVVQVIETRNAGQYSFEDLKEQIRTELLQRKRRQTIVDGLRRTTYVELKQTG